MLIDFFDLYFRLGAGGRDYKQLAQDIEHTTGGLNCSPHLAPHHSEEDSFEQVHWVSIFLR